MCTNAEISYHFGRACWGKGIATEVVDSITYFGMKELKLHRIQGIVRTENLPSIAVLKKNGYQEEGILKLYPFGKEFHNVVILSIVDENNLSNRIGISDRRKRQLPPFKRIVVYPIALIIQLSTLFV